MYLNVLKHLMRIEVAVCQKCHEKTPKIPRNIQTYSNYNPIPWFHAWGVPSYLRLLLITWDAEAPAYELVPLTGETNHL